MKLRRAKYYLRLTYPIRIVAREGRFRGDFPDLPGCALADDDLRRLYCRLEAARQEWIIEHVLAGDAIPLPNSHLCADAMAAATAPSEHGRPA